MTPRQRALAAFQIESATTLLSEASARERPRDPSTVLRQSANSAAEAEEFANGLASIPRKLKVVVQPSPAGAAPPMTVYVLPFGVFRYGNVVDEKTLHNLIDLLLFQKLTSPSEGELEPGITYAIWVGSKHSADKMTAIVRQGKVNAYRLIDAAQEHLPDVTFNASDQVVTR
jgi:hypothetical protein